MRTSKYLLSTLKEEVVKTEIISYQLMLRAGMIRKLAAGLYSWLPTGLRVLRKAEKIIREEIEKLGAMEMSMPMVQPADLWQKSGRWSQYGPELLKFHNRSKRAFALSPTHEEVITEIMKHEINSYKQLPLIFYQIQTKFRDEMRPRFGIMRSREFIMKDAYSFHSDQISLQKTYDDMYQAYSVIFKRMGLKICIVQADNGHIGGRISHEFQVLTNNGENYIVLSTKSDYAANIELAEAITPIAKDNIPSENMRLVDIPDINNITELSTRLALPEEKTAKILLVHAKKGIHYPLIALMIRGDHQLNERKAEKLPQVAVPLIYASEEDARLATGIDLNLLGPFNLSLPLIVDRSVAAMNNFVTNSNISGKYFFGINWKRDLPIPEVADLRKVVDGDISPDGNGTLQIKRGIEVGHIFQLGTKYSELINATIQGQYRCNQTLVMGCYGIGITRAVAASIEQNHDKRGILWPEALAPFNVAILPINIHYSLRVRRVSEDLYKHLQMHGIDVLFDDRKERLGTMFADVDIIGIPHQLVISERNLDTEKIEYKNRFNGEHLIIKLSVIIDFLLNKLTKVN